MPETLHSIPPKNTKKCTVSVIMPVHNGERYLKEAIDSILTQTIQDFELLVVNDGSTDTSRSIVESYTDPRIFLINQQNQGIAASVNSGITMAQGKFIARMDADDISYPERLEKQLAYLTKHPDIQVCGTGATLIDPNKNAIGVRVPPEQPETIKKNMLWINQMMHPTILFRREFFDQFGAYDKTCKYAEDYELWLRALNKGAKLGNIPEPLLYYRANPKSETRGKTRLPFIKKVLSIQTNAIKQYHLPIWSYFFTTKTMALIFFEIVKGTFLKLRGQAKQAR